MIPATYRDLAEFGLPLITPDDPSFASIAEEIRARGPHFGPDLADSNTAAILVNQSGKAVITMAWIWRYGRVGQGPRASWHSDLGSSTQMDLLTGRTRVTPHPSGFILPGSKRLITESRMLGDNTDVLAPDPRAPGGGFGFAGGGGRAARREEDVTGIELQLDFVIFDDGLCAGPDAGERFENLTADLEQRRATVEEIVRELRGGASAGRIFEILQPLARHRMQHRDHFPVVLTMFAAGAIRQLTRLDDNAALLRWFEDETQPNPMKLHRPA